MERMPSKIVSFGHGRTVNHGNLGHGVIENLRFLGMLLQIFEDRARRKSGRALVCRCGRNIPGVTIRARATLCLP